MEARLRLGGKALGSGSLYRHLERTRVDEFFDTGSLYLTTLAHCQTHPIVSRRDPREGQTNFSMQDGDLMMAGISKAGGRSYLLSTSISCGKDIQTRFGTDSWIEIFDVAGFADAVAKVLGCKAEPLVGGCLYTDVKQVDDVAPFPLNDIFAPLQKALEIGEPEAVAEFHNTNKKICQLGAELVGDNAFFMKDRVPYEIEDEVRFAWFVDQPVKPRPFLCPDARDFCNPGHK